jgi:hypothetical protein
MEYDYYTNFAPMLQNTQTQRRRIMLFRFFGSNDQQERYRQIEQSVPFERKMERHSKNAHQLRFN